jgi:hypothetical protein
MNTESPLICNMDVFTPSQREAHIHNTIELIQAIQAVQNVDNGYEFTFPNESVMISKIAEFISNERLCCPFLNFTLDVLSNTEVVALSLTGPIGTQDFLRVEFEGAF